MSAKKNKPVKISVLSSTPAYYSQFDYEEAKAQLLNGIFTTMKRRLTISFMAVILFLMFFILDLYLYKVTGKWYDLLLAIAMLLLIILNFNTLKGQYIKMKEFRNELLIGEL